MKDNKNSIKILADQKFLRISPRKVRLMAKMIKKYSPSEALEYLKFLNKKPAYVLGKVLRQAISNAVNNLKLNEGDLVFDQILVEAGPTFKRWQPVSRGRAHPILKRTCHIKILLKSKILQARNPKSEARKNIKNINKPKLTKSK